MAPDSERRAGYRLARAIILALLWVFFVTALVMSARQGVALAKEHLARREAGANALPRSPGTRVTVEAGSHPVAFGETAGALREYFLTIAVRGSADASGPPAGVKLLEGTLEADMLEADGNLVKVRIAEGGREGEIYWVRREQVRPAD